ncbi:hypothetical protein T492DRAFT_6788 [Pavlovales sp. CCMP2436]|nr:hypothetical protein T492DRAFT_6788 [Pavlovales sp. CCMP2436]
MARRASLRVAIALAAQFALLAAALSEAAALPAPRRPTLFASYLGEHAKLVARARQLVGDGPTASPAPSPTGWARIRRELLLAPARYIVPATAASLCGAAIDIVRPALRGALIDLAATGGSPLWPLLRRLAAFNAFAWAAAIVSSTLFARARWRLVMLGRARLLRAALESEGVALGGRSAGELVGRLERDTDRLTDAAVHLVDRLAGGGVAVLISLWAMWRIDARLCVIGVLIRSPLTLAITKVAAERVGLYGAVQSEKLAALDRRSSEIVAQASTVQLSGVVDQELAAAAALGDEVVRVIDQTVDAETALRFTKLLLEGVQEVATAALGLGAVRAGKLTVGQYISFIGFLGVWSSGYEHLLGVWQRLEELRRTLAPYFALLDGPRAVSVKQAGSGAREAVASAQGEQQQQQQDGGLRALGRATHLERGAVGAEASSDSACQPDDTGADSQPDAAAVPVPAECRGELLVRDLRYTYASPSPASPADALGSPASSGTPADAPGSPASSVVSLLSGGGLGISAPASLADGGNPAGGGNPADGASTPEALRGVSLRIEAGTSIALVGASGSGKSTLASSLARLLQPSAGSVLLDGVSLEQLEPAWLRAHVAVVPQDARLFDRSLLENIRLHADASDAEVCAAAAAVGVDQIAKALPLGLETACGEGGCRLSGGQRYDE